MWFRLDGDARLGRCATDGCGGQPTSRLEHGGVGSNYCSGCREKIEHPEPSEVTVRRMRGEWPDGWRLGVAGCSICMGAEIERLRDQLEHSGRERALFSSEIERLRDLAASLMALLDHMPVKHPQQSWQRNELRRQFDAAVGRQQSQNTEQK